MPIYPLDAVRNAPIDRKLEPVLERVRERISRASGRDAALGEEILEAFDQARPRLNVLAAMIGRLDGPGADISTGLGFLPLVLDELRIPITATERHPRASTLLAGTGHEVRPYDIGRTPPPFSAGSLGYAVFGEVLEHLRFSPVPVLVEIAGLLRPGGRLLLTTPNIARLSHLQALAAGENFLEAFDSDLPLGHDATASIEHVREYSVREVVEALEAAGLGVEQIAMTGWGEEGYSPIANPFCNGIIVAEAIR